ncbi:hypothetical protein [Streptomyces sp. NPDC001621]|uniref:MmyB family transcriptional regulator n=1 Tax=Streptomyces sp. NPDC001621 TaxID=3364594 RepID=UPI00367A0A4A
MSRQWTPHHSLQGTLDATTAGPAVVCNGRTDVLAANPLAPASYNDLFAQPSTRPTWPASNPSARRPVRPGTGQAQDTPLCGPPWRAVRRGPRWRPR